MRPMLRPGLNVLRRDVRTLQLGLEWPGLAALQASASVRAVLAAVDGFRDVSGVVLAAEAAGITTDDALQAVEALLDAGALVDQSAVRPGHVDDSTWAAMWLLAGPAGTAHDVLSSRRQVRVWVTGSGRISAMVRSLVAAEQVTVTDTPARSTLVVVAADMEPPRAAVDETMRLGVPFLCVGVRELVGLVGPFVVPGRTACLRCVDLSRSQVDPCWTTLVDSAQTTPAKTHSCPPSLVAMTAGYAAQEVVLWASGALPVCCDNVVEIPHGLGTVQTVGFQQHPHCGCGWGTEHETMGA